MSGETEVERSGWTTDTLKYHTDDRIKDLSYRLDERYNHQVQAIERQLDDLRHQLDERAIAQQRALDTAWTAAQQAIHDARTAAQEAIDLRASTLDREFHEHLEQQRHETKMMMDASDKAIKAAFESSNTAILKAEAATERRFDSVNEFRAQLNDQATRFMPREVADATFKELRGQLAVQQSRLDASGGRTEGVRMSSGALVAAVGVFVSIIVAVNILVPILTGR